MVIRFIVIGLFGISMALLLYAYKKQPYASHLPGIAVWCFHVIVFTFIAALRGAGVLEVNVPYMNVWSNIIRIHGGIVMLATGLYYLYKKES